MCSSISGKAGPAGRTASTTRCARLQGSRPPPLPNRKKPKWEKSGRSRAFVFFAGLAEHAADDAAHEAADAGGIGTAAATARAMATASAATPAAAGATAGRLLLVIACRGR